MNIFWHQRDLRIPDNRGLARAAVDGPTVPVYIVDTELLDTLGDRQRAFFMQGVRKLKSAYRARESDLIVREGSPTRILPSLVDDYDADCVYYNDHYDPARRERQRRVDELVPTHSTMDLLLVDPAELDEYYENHGCFADDWTEIEKRAPAAPLPANSLGDISDDHAVPDFDADIDLPPAGYDAARVRYDQFLDAGIETYADTRDDMTAAVEHPVGAVSRLSPYLAAGMIGIREIWRDATDRLDGADSSIRRNVEKFRDELSWREQYYHLLYYNQDLPTENYKPIPNPIQWRNDPEQLATWKAGETGYPLVDAGMRQLNDEGYIHNQPRQNVASFLTKHLLIDWRKGARYFREQLVDYDPANNAGNWQWIASTGTDSVDVRIFDPVAQMAKYDVDADYVTEYVPELRAVPAAKIVDWPTLDESEQEELAPAYPHPIVDRDAAYERAQRVFKTALGKR